ncbi:spirocyclase AveC family protein [Kitasatospora sp. NPDC005748]|uniref:spirocyclase AveC family protein n=1 Tax=Kitasatospora sp. NPDC005748 TaxID=3157063 RepID=UPI0033F2D2FC
MNGNPAPATPGPAAPRQGQALPASRRRSPVGYWAAFGLACLILQGVVYARWIIGGDAHAHSARGYSIPHAMKVTTHIGQGTAGLLFLALTAVVWRECRTQGRITFKAAVFTGFCFSFWSNPYVSQFHYAAGNNRYDLNVETWGPYLPGWRGDTPAVESFLMEMAYPVMLLWLVVALTLARLFGHRRPNWGRGRLFAATTLAMLVCEPVLTHLYQRLGGFAYPRALPGHLTLFEGRWYQLPVTSTLAVVGFFIVPLLAMVLYARPGHEVHLFRGCELLPRRLRPWSRLLAGAGLMNACTLGFQITMALVSLVSHPIDLPGWLDRPAR